MPKRREASTGDGCPELMMASQKREEERQKMRGYLELIAAADFVNLDAILEAASIDSTITDAQYYYLRQKAIERGTRLLFAHA